MKSFQALFHFDGYKGGRYKISNFLINSRPAKYWQTFNMFKSLNMALED